MKKLIDFRILGIMIVLVAIVSFAIGVTVGDISSPATGSTVVYNGATWDASSVEASGLGITFDGNTVCFVDGSAGCDNNIDWNGTDIIISTS